jgi:hypothetical protein
VSNNKIETRGFVRRTTRISRVGIYRIKTARARDNNKIESENIGMITARRGSKSQKKMDYADLLPCQMTVHNVSGLTGPFAAEDRPPSPRATKPLNNRFLGSTLGFVIIWAWSKMEQGVLPRSLSNSTPSMTNRMPSSTSQTLTAPVPGTGKTSKAHW